jgi:hypothetical protein
MRVRNPAKCIVCGKPGRPLDAEGYVCQDCQKEKAQETVEQDADEAALEQIRKQTEAALENPVAPPHSSPAPAPEEPPPTAKQMRRSISVKGITDARVGVYARALGRSKSSVIEEMIHERLDAVGAPVPTKIDRPKPTPQRETSRDYHYPLML